MPVESGADRAMFVNQDDFGIAAQLETAGGVVVINGIFDSEPELSGLRNDLGVQSGNPVFVCRTIDLPADLADADTMTIAGGVYLVRQRMHDGTGMTTLELEADIDA